MISMFFFKQKTAYEMRISDWSSDVCSSDLLERHRDSGHGQSRRARLQAGDGRQGGAVQALRRCRRDRPRTQDRGCRSLHRRGRTDGAELRRSEEHTSELQSLMRISYAVFCLKKKKT